MTTRTGPAAGAARLVLPALAGGVALALSLPPWGWWPLAPLGAALVYRHLESLTLGRRLLAGWVVGLGCFVPGLFWAQAFNWYGAVVLMVVEAASMAVAAALVPKGPPAWQRMVAFVGAFTLLEALRLSWPFGGLPLGGIFLGQAGGPLLASARLGGPLGLTALVWTAGAALAELATFLWRRWRTRRTERWRVALPGLVAAALVVAVPVAGLLAPDGGPAAGAIEVAAIQGGGRRGVSQAEVAPSSVFAAQLATTDRLLAAAGGGPRRRLQLVVWPEDVISVDGPLAGTPQAATMARLARGLQATLVAGVTETVSATAFKNMAVAWGPDGRIVGSYEKVHRVPFGEYVPYRSFFAHFASLSGVPLDAVPGHGDGLLRTPAGPIGVMLSYEVFYADRSRPAVQAGARLLVVPTNTSSYATSQVPGQEVAADRVQAVEEGRDLVQAAPTGYSTLVDNQGNVLARSPLSRPWVLLGRPTLHDGLTVYTRLGDWPVLALCALALAAGWAGRLMSARRRRPPAGHS